MKIFMLPMVLTMLLGACVTNDLHKSKDFIRVKPVNKPESVVYIYRPYSMSNMMISPDIFMDGEKIAIIENNSYLYVMVLPGKYSLKLNLDARYSGVRQLSLNVESEKSVYIRVSTAVKFEMNKPYSRSFNLEQVNEKIAWSEIQKTKYTGEDKSDEKNKEKPVKMVEEKQDSEGQYSISKSRNPFSH